MHVKKKAEMVFTFATAAPKEDAGRVMALLS